MKSKTGPFKQREGYTKERCRPHYILKKDVDHTRSVGGSFNNQVNLHMRLVLGGHKMSRSLPPLVKII